MCAKASGEGEGGRAEFPAFPFEPYAIQQGFMEHLYRAIEHGKIGMFESPTGTGKTLSLLCGALHWLSDDRARSMGSLGFLSAAPGDGAGMAASPATEALPGWLTTQADDLQAQRERDRAERRARRTERARRELEAERARSATGPSALLQGGGASTRRAVERRETDAKSKVDDDARFVVDDWDSDDGGSGAPKRRRAGGGVSSESDATSGSDDDPDDAGGAASGPQVIICSRAHSQITQLVGELRRTPFAQEMHSVALASRQQLCINPAVRKLGSAARINEACLDLQRTKSSGTKKARGAREDGKATAMAKGCEFLCKGRERDRARMRDAILAAPMDIEDLAKLGSSRRVCPYYAARDALPHADVVCVPYSSVLSRSAREALGLRVAGSVVILDEAHNIVDAVNGAYSATVTAKQLAATMAHLAGYLSKFSSRLSPSNLKYLRTMELVAGKLLDAANGGKPARAPDAGRSDATARGSEAAQTINAFLFASGLDNVNMFKLMRYMRESKVLVKLSSYWEAESEAVAAVVGSGSASAQVPSGERMAALHAFAGMVEALTTADDDGRLVRLQGPSDGAAGSAASGGGGLRFILLNAASQFGRIVSEARSVILASGTLSPVASIAQQLFPEVPGDRILHYSCGHVIPPSSLLLMAAGRGPTSQVLDFRAATRSSDAMVDELGRLVANVSAIVPGGVVLFLPSFGTLDVVRRRWQASGALDGLAKKKQPFFEPTAAAELEGVLAKYASAVRSPNAPATGALLVAVVGGKLSEGINFGDDLGRCVVVAGMPYPNRGDPELQERLRFIDRCAAKVQVKTSGPEPALTSAEHYENLCMRALNQSIGRAARHAGDFAAIILADVRYERAAEGLCGGGGLRAPLTKLPDWMKPSLRVARRGFGDVMVGLRSFFASRK
ncbi:unnamed protein product [Pedinophyceae sp. YPF-701]|nr:unnamed protein product [Pedinophyceae sp. YPF-701]